MQRLTANARVSNRSIGRSLGIAESVVRARLHRMRSLGILRFSAIVDPHSWRRHTQVSLWIDADDAGAISSIAGALAERPAFHAVMTLAGRADILALMVVHDGTRLVEQVGEAISGIERIRRIRYGVSQRILKQALIHTGSEPPDAPRRIISVHAHNFGRR